VRHAAEDTKSKVDDTLSAADSKVHEAKVKSGRIFHRAGEKVRGWNVGESSSQ
jgi:hypothetical protein